MRRALLLATTLLAFTAPAADAACGDGAYTVPQGVQDPPLVVGDSVALGARDNILGLGAALDARECRTFGQGIQALASHDLPPIVIVALGTNPPVERGQVEKAVDVVGDRSLAFVIPRELRSTGGAAAKAIRSVAAKHPEITLLDWPAESADHEGWFAGDGLHLQGAGPESFAALIGGFIQTAELGSFDADAGVDAVDGAADPGVPPEAALSDDELAFQATGAIARAALDNLISLPWSIVKAPFSGLVGKSSGGASEADPDPIAPQRTQRSHLPPWDT